MCIAAGLCALHMHVWKKVHGLNEQDMTRCWGCLLHGMLQLHTRQIIHRDLKSPNLLVDKHWRVKVCDFNLSRVESSAQDKTSSISANNPRWLAPEVISSRVRFFVPTCLCQHRRLLHVSHALSSGAGYCVMG